MSVISYILYGIHQLIHSQEHLFYTSWVTCNSFQFRSKDVVELFKNLHVRIEQNTREVYISSANKHCSTYVELIVTDITVDYIHCDKHLSDM